jgi:hypothetical protein
MSSHDEQPVEARAPLGDHLANIRLGHAFASHKVASRAHHHALSMQKRQAGEWHGCTGRWARGEAAVHEIAWRERVTLGVLVHLALEHDQSWLSFMTV